MHVTNVRVSFLREKQPAQYEKAAPSVEFVATLEPYDDHRLAARSLMIDATAVVYAGIGYAVPEKVAKALLDGDTTDKLSVTVETTETPPAASETAEDAPATEGNKPKTRGRPKGSTNTRPKKGTKAAKEAEAAAAAAANELAAGAVGDDDGVPGDEETPNISTGEERVNPNDSEGIPGDDADTGDQREEHVPDAAEFTPKDLHSLIMSHVNATPRTLSVANAKQVLAHFKVARAQDLTNEQAFEGKALVEAMIKAAAGK